MNQGEWILEEEISGETDERSEDRIWLEKLANALETEAEWPRHFQDQMDDILARLRSIAIGCDQLALERRRMVRLEEQVDAKLCKEVEKWLSMEETSADFDCVAATWLLSRRTKSAGNMQALGGGLGALGTAALASMFKGK
jgi:hypothetical protein